MKKGLLYWLLGCLVDRCPPPEPEPPLPPLAGGPCLQPLAESPCVPGIHVSICARKESMCARHSWSCVAGQRPARLAFLRHTPGNGHMITFLALLLATYPGGERLVAPLGGRAGLCLLSCCSSLNTRYGMVWYGMVWYGRAGLCLLSCCSSLNTRYGKQSHSSLLDNNQRWDSPNSIKLLNVQIFFKSYAGDLQIFLTISLQSTKKQADFRRLCVIKIAVTFEPIM